MNRFVLPILMILAAAGPTAARDTLADVLQRGELRWAGDEEGGAPYIYRAEAGANELVGFEFELMRHIAGKLGVKSAFQQGDWKNLLNQLNKAKTCDIAVNGIELTPERLRESICTIPYFVYELHLFGRPDETRAGDWDSLRKAKPDGSKWTVGVLENTSADQVMTTKFAEHVEVRRYNGTTEGFRDVENRNLDFTVTDTPAAGVYRTRFKVKQLGPAIERGYYVMYLRTVDTALRDRIDAILKAAIADGTLRTMYAKYGVWPAIQETLVHPDTQALPTTIGAEQLESGNRRESGHAVSRYLPLLLRAAATTVFLSVVAMPLAIAFGLFVALVRLYSPGWLSWPFAIYVEVIRGTPLLLQLLFLYFGVLPWLFELLPAATAEWVRPYGAIIASLTGLALNYAAYEAEIYRAGLLAIPRGQMEAALALGLTRRQAIRHVIVPQALRIVVPPVTNDFINLFKDTAVCSVITMVDLSKMYNIAVNNMPHAFAELALVTAGLYLAMSYPLSLLTRRLEKQQGRTIV